MALFSISCKKATYLVSKKEEGKLNWMEKIRLRSHMAICRVCRLFEEQTQLFTQHAKHMHLDESLSAECKDKIEHALKQAQ